MTGFLCLDLGNPSDPSPARGVPAVLGLAKTHEADHGWVRDGDDEDIDWREVWAVKLAEVTG